MRSVPSGSFERLSSLEALWAAWHAYRRGKRRRPAVAAFDLDADARLCGLHRALQSGAYRPGVYRVQVVRDPKTRVVAAPAMADRVVQRALVDDIGPTYERGFIAHSYAVGTGRGPHRALLCYLGWTRQYRYRLSLDIRRYFPSMHHDTLLGLFARRLRDDRTVALLAGLVAAGAAVYRMPVTVRVLGLEADPVAPGCGLPLGGYLSHWSGGLYLDGLDHFVKRELKVHGYLRYMDDFSLFHDDVARLESARTAIADWLRRERRLELKPVRQDVQPAQQPSTYLGFRVSRAGILPGPKAKRRLRARLQQVDAGGLDRLARGLQSFQGMMLSLG